METNRSEASKGTGFYKCAACGKLTRNTYKGEAEVGYCAHCLEVGEYANAVRDGSMSSEDVPEHLLAEVLDLV